MSYDDGVYEVSLRGREVAAAARRCEGGGWEGLAEAMGLADCEEFRRAAREASPGVDGFLARPGFLREAADCRSRGDMEGFKGWRLEAVRATAEVTADPSFRRPASAEDVALLASLRPAPVVEPLFESFAGDADGAEGVAASARKAPRRGSGGSRRSTGRRQSMVADDVPVVGAVPPGLVESEPMRELVVGYAGRQYCGRDVVVVRRGEVFGCPGPTRGRTRLNTLFNGILNQCEILDGPPGASWAVLDACSELRDGFTKREAVDLAMARHPGVHERQALEFAYDQIKGHHRHPRRREAGMSHMFVELGEGRMAIRGRTAQETLQLYTSPIYAAAVAAAEQSH